jgi:hypothetical protein
LSKVPIPLAAAGDVASRQVPRTLHCLHRYITVKELVRQITSGEEVRAIFTNYGSSAHLSPGVRGSCMGAGNYGHEYHGHDGHDHRYDNGHEYHGHDGHDHRYDNGNEHYGNYRYHW